MTQITSCCQQTLKFQDVTCWPQSQLDSHMNCWLQATFSWICSSRQCNKSDFAPDSYYYFTIKMMADTVDFYDGRILPISCIWLGILYPWKQIPVALKGENIFLFVWFQFNWKTTKQRKIVFPNYIIKIRRSVCQALLEEPSTLL